MTTTRFANYRFGLLLAVALLGTGAALCTSGVESKEPQAAPIANKNSDRPAPNIPQYTDKGELKLPADFQTWVFVGANMGLEYREPAAQGEPRKNDKQPPAEKPVKVGNFHNVYINPEAYAHYMKTGEFPEPTLLVLDIYEAQRGEPGSVVSEGLFPGKHKDIAVAVKNSARPDGSKTDWAYYDFPTGQTFAKAFPNKSCYDCHLEHADVDNVWTQFYPGLRKRPQNREKQ